MTNKPKFKPGQAVWVIDAITDCKRPGKVRQVIRDGTCIVRFWDSGGNYLVRIRGEWLEPRDE